MAVTVNGNTLYMTANNDVHNERNLKIRHIIVAATAASDEVNIKDANDDIKLTVVVSSKGETHLDLSSYPIFFATGVKITYVSGTPPVSFVVERGSQ